MTREASRGDKAESSRSKTGFKADCPYRAPAFNGFEQGEGSERTGSGAPEIMLRPEDEIDPRPEREESEDTPEIPPALIDVALPVHHF